MTHHAIFLPFASSSSSCYPFPPPFVSSYFLIERHDDKRVMTGKEWRVKENEHGAL